MDSHRVSAIFEGFPEFGIQAYESFTPGTSQKKLEQRLIQTLRDVNKEKFAFEQIASPTIPGCTIIFEFGIACSDGFTFIYEGETKKTLVSLKQRTYDVMDFFCAIRYYKEYPARKKPQKFDYYLARFVLNQNLVQLQVFHERGPRYFSPKDMVAFLASRINGGSGRRSRKFLKPIRKATD